MKKFFISLACFAAFCSCEAQQHQLTVNLSGLDNDTVVVGLVDRAMRSYEKQDTVIAKNGTFTYDVDGDKARYVLLQFPSPEGLRRMPAYVVPGEQGTLTGTLASAQWSGTKFFTDLAKLEEITDAINAKMNALSQEFQQKAAAGANVDSLRNVIVPQYEALAKQMDEARVNFVKQNPNSDVCAVLVGAFEPDQAEELIAGISESVKKGAFSDFIDNAIAAIDADKAQKEAAKKVAEGMPAPDFTLMDINGKPLSLSSLRGKYVVLDFWGSWCGWCIKGLPEMKEYYKKYAGKFEILGIDCNDTEQKWKDAVAKHEIPWLHVYNKRGEGDICNDYAITGFPTKIIIDPEGKIAKTVVGESPEFYQFLDEKFGK